MFKKFSIVCGNFETPQDSSKKKRLPGCNRAAYCYREST